MGMKIWGAVAEVNAMDLVVSLPGGLRGFVKIEEASDVLAASLKHRDTKRVSRKRSKCKEEDCLLNDSKNIVLTKVCMQ